MFDAIVSNKISIHSPLAGRDNQTEQNPLGFCMISIHSPLAGRDVFHPHNDTETNGFQSTRPSRGETFSGRGCPATSRFQSTRPSRGETPPYRPNRTLPTYFNPLAPRGARQYLYNVEPPFHNFNPLAPRGARRRTAEDKVVAIQFQSTRPSRGETSAVIPSHSSANRFQSTRPSRGETQRRARPPLIERFQSTRPSRGETAKLHRITLVIMAIRTINHSNMVDQVFSLRHNLQLS